MYLCVSKKYIDIKVMVYLDSTESFLYGLLKYMGILLTGVGQKGANRLFLHPFNIPFLPYSLYYKYMYPKLTILERKGLLKSYACLSMFDVHSDL